jgi:hypothetical protein
MAKQENTLKLAEVQAQLAATTHDTLQWQANMRAVVANAIGEIDVQQIVQKQVDKAKAGDANAAKFIMNTVLGLATPVRVTQTNVITDPASSTMNTSHMLHQHAFWLDQVATAAKIAQQNRATDAGCVGHEGGAVESILIDMVIQHDAT